MPQDIVERLEETIASGGPCAADARAVRDAIAEIKRLRVLRDAVQDAEPWLRSVAGDVKAGESFQEIREKAR